MYRRQLQLELRWYRSAAITDTVTYGVGLQVAMP